MTDTGEVPTELLRALKERGMDEEIEMLKQAKAQGLKPDQVQKWVERYNEETLDPERAVRIPGTDKQVNLPQPAIDAIRANQPTVALKVMTSASFFDLKTSRRLIDAYCEQHDLPPPFSSPALRLKAIAGVVIFAIFGYLWFRYMR